MAAAIQEADPTAIVTLVPGGKGVFRVVAEGTELWNKHETGNFPAPSAIVDRLRNLA